MEVAVQYLLFIYAGAVLLNAVASLALWWKLRDSLTRGQLLIWAAVFVALVAQSLFIDGLQKAIGLVIVFVTTMAIASLIAQVGKTQLRWRLAMGIMALGTAIGALVYLLYPDPPFALVTAPIAIAVAFPVLATAIEVIFARWSKSTVSRKGLGLAAIFFGMHMLDFPYLANQGGAAVPLGFTLGVLSIFGLSIFVPAVVLETVTAEHARTAAEMEAARRIQLELLPKEPSIPGIELSCYMQPAEEVGGDYYDIYAFGDRAWIILGDVTDHGLSSGLVMLMAQSIISAILHTQNDIGPAELHRMANEILFNNLNRMNEDRTMTIVAICIEDTQRLVVSGHHDDVYIHRKATGEVDIIPVDHIPFSLGLIDIIDPTLTTETNHTLGPGDTMFVITDGVTEATRGGNFDDGMFDADGLVEYIKSSVELPLEDIKQGLVALLDEFTGGVFHDDVTFVIARRSEAT